MPLIFANRRNGIIPACAGSTNYPTIMQTLG